MGKICLLLFVSLAVQLLFHAQARHSQMLCQRLEKNCRKYEEYCSSSLEDNISTTDNTTNSTANDTTNNTNNSNHMAAMMWPSCCDLARSADNEAASGVYSIYGPGGHFSTQQAYCDIDQSGNWTVIQRRTNGTLLFNRTWAEYVDGFGALTSEFWYGLTNIHWLTRDNPWHLQIKLTSNDGDVYIHQYSQFRVASSDNNYKLEVSGYKKGKDSKGVLSEHSDQPFSTGDKINNDAPCCETGWWYIQGRCIGDGAMNVNGRYNSDRGILWTPTVREERYIVETEMKIQPHNCLDVISN